jgi:hypothetical protein
LPLGNHLTDAQLQLHFFGAGKTDSGLFVTSVAPIDPAQPFTSSTAGSHFGNATVTLSLATGEVTLFNDFSVIGFFNTVRDFDYTQAVQAALLANGQLAPIDISERLTYGFKTALSPFPGLNSITTFNEIFSLQNAQLDAVLTINYDTPEPSTASYFVVGMAALIATLARRARRSTVHLAA